MLRRGVVHSIPTGDGITFPFYVLSRDVPPIHPPLRGTYRPVGIPERTDIQLHLEGKTGRSWDEAAATALAVRVKTWDAKAYNDAGQIVPVPITQAGALTLEPTLFNNLCSVVLFGSRSSDMDPEWESSDQDLAEKARVQAVAEGRPVSDVLLEIQAKNSSKGSG